MSVKNTLYKILGHKTYLKLLHHSFHTIYKLGLLKNDPVYKYHYFIKNVIQPGYTVLDIGANLGYYTRLFSDWVGTNGHVYAVEPIEIYRNTIMGALSKRTNITLHPFALGSEEKEIFLGIPSMYEITKTGAPHVLEQGEQTNNMFPATMKQASKLFSDIPKIDFIKMDIEGYERYVIPEMRAIILQHKPVLLLETWGPHRQQLEQYIYDMGYLPYSLESGLLKPFSDLENTPVGDIFFVHAENTSTLDQLRKKGLAL